jgi:hypothetical protein
VRMVKTTAETLANRERAMYRHMGWLAVPQTPQEMNQTYRRERQLETAIATETDTGPESLMDESDRLATWLLDYHDALKDDDRITKVVEMSNSLADKQRIKTLNEAIARHGLTHVYDMAAQFKENYLESMRKIDVPLSATEQSQSTVFELLATALQNYPDLLDDSDKSHAIRGMLVDKLVGQTVAKIVTEADGKDANDRSLIRKVRQIVPTGEVNDDGQPTQKIREVLVFNKKFFTAKDSPWISSHQRKIWTQVDKLRKPLQDKAQHVFQMVEHEQTPTDDDYREFGRLLRRSIGH